LLQPGIYQPRKDVASDALEELAASIKSQGIIQPIVVRQVDNNKYEIIAGERRWRASKLIGLKVVPCVVKAVQDRAAIAMALIENIQREDLNVIEEAQALDRLQREFDLTHGQVAEVIGKSRTAVSNLLRLNQLETEVKNLVEKKSLDMGHARALLALSGTEQLNIAEKVADKRLTVRQTEQLVKNTLQPKPKLEIDQEVLDISERLSNKLGSAVSITRSPKGKTKLTITIDEAHKLESLITKLES
jgi:ParB family chromosome partitioning protein